MKTALITGATRGIGRETAILFAQNGYNVIGVYEKNESLASKIASDYGITFYKCDISDKKQVLELHTALLKTFGTIDVIINNAGISLSGVFHTIHDDDQKHLYEVNLFGTLNITKSFISDMINQKKGVIINISSIFGEIGASCEVDYSTSKAAIIGFTKSLAKECGPSGVRVNCVCPGIIDTDMNAALTIEEIADFVDSVPLECLGKPCNIAQTLLFLASDAAEYITGAVIDVNGGLN
ncbi:MAG: SDR family NAD(P)-dependent oxidoreductase [Clostridia bacterium]